MEDIDGTVSVTTKHTTRDAEGQLVHREVVEQRRVCGHQEAQDYPGDCNIVSSPFIDGGLWRFEEERRMAEVMARESP